MEQQKKWADVDIEKLATLTGQSGPIVKVWLTAKTASPGKTPMPTRSEGEMSIRAFTTLS